MTMARVEEKATTSYSVGDNWPDNGTLHFYLSVPSINLFALKT